MLILRKARAHKYLQRIPKKSGKGWWYIYAKDLKRPFNALLQIFGIGKKKIDSTYETVGAKETFGADKLTFAQHVLEYFRNKSKWDNFFSKNKTAGTKTVTMKETRQAAGAVKDGKKATPKAANVINRSLMRAIWNSFNQTEAKNAEDRVVVGQRELSAGAQAIRSGGSESTGNIHVSGAETGDNGNKPLLDVVDVRERSGRDIRLTKGGAKAIRAKCLEILKKADSDITDEDKEILSQYEGAGGLGEDGASTHGTLYEFYTPHKVVDKVWALVDKYIQGAKSVLEPSSGVGRFADNRPNDKITLNELDPTSARIARLLHGESNVKEGAFQEMFKAGKPYDGKKYDVVIGNPPYGAYEGIWKGRGEGKEHSRYEEYFIDRGLDTLREGGIMAYVVPSGFLDGANDKIKEKIAAKGKLLEAWRLPNGVFNTTGVGTDIIVLRKEKGDPADMSFGNYFTKEPKHICGDVAEKTNRFGKMEKYVALRSGETFDSVVDGIDAGATEAVPMGELTVKEAAQEAVSVSEAHQNRSDAMMGNDNAKKDGAAEAIDKKRREVELAEWELENAIENKNNNNLSASGSWGNTPSNRAYVARELQKLTDKVKAARKNLGEKKSELKELLKASSGNTKIKKSFSALSSVLGTGKRAKVKNKEVGDIFVEAGDTGKSGYGLKHMIEQRSVEDGLSEDDITALLYLAIDAVKTEKPIQRGKIYEFSKNGIVAIVKRFEDKGNEKYVLTGFADWNKEKEATGAIQTVNAQYGYTPEFSSFRKQVGAVVSSLTVSSKTPEKSSGNARSEAMKGNQNAAGAHNVMSMGEFNQKYAKNIAPETLEMWKATNWDGSIDVFGLDKDYIKKSGNYVQTADGKWYDIVNFASGNIYKKLAELERDRDMLSKKEYERQKTILETVKPKQKTVMQFEVSPLTDFAAQIFEVDGEDHDLISEFRDYVWSLEKNDIPGGIYKTDILDYVSGKGVRRESGGDEVAAEAEKQDKIEKRRNFTEKLFNEWLRDTVAKDVQKAVEDKWNDRYNAVVKKDVSKIPLFVEGISREFKGKPLEIAKIQLESASEAVADGNKVLALDVGVGKTLTSILVNASLLQTGKAKRPLICVPKAVYLNWQSEIAGLFPDIKVNMLGNLRDAPKTEDGKLDIEDGTLSIITYEGLEKVGFKDETVDTELLQDMLDSQFNSGDKDSKREIAKQKQKIMTVLGKATAGDGVYWEDTGFDNITIDEFHNFKNVFASVKPKKTKGANGKETANTNEFQAVVGGAQSDRALKMYAITQMIQRENEGRGVIALTATPFQNHPVEIYNVLSMVARQKLKDAGIYNLHEFMAQFAELKREISVTGKGEVEYKTVMKSFKNLGALQDLINTYITKVDGETAGVIRPNRNTHTPRLTMTDEQRKINNAITEYMQNADSKEDPGATLRGLNALRMNALSPALVNDDILDKINIVRKDSRLVESSPKLKFVCDTVKKVFDDHPQKGQVIYMPKGVTRFKEMGEYLQKLGIKKEQIAYLGGKEKDEEKEKIMADFNNPEGTIKIIIGSDTMSEGVNLNGNSIALYDTMLDWNPTKKIQVEGRIWRQGNRQGQINIVTPLMNDTVDSFMMQKHDEKAHRIDAIFNDKSEKLNVEDINPEEVKLQLIRDPVKRAKAVQDVAKKELRQKQSLEQNLADKLYNAGKNSRELMAEIEESKKDLEILASIADRKLETEAQYGYFNARIDDNGYNGYIPNGTGRTMDEAVKNAKKNIADQIKKVKKAYKANESKLATIKSMLERNGVDTKNGIDENAIEAVAKKHSHAAIKIGDEIDAIDKDSKRYIAEAERQIDSEKFESVSVEEGMAAISKSILENIEPMDAVKKRILAAREAKAGLAKSRGKKILVMRRKIA